MELVEHLRDFAEWADHSCYDLPLFMADILREAADTIEEIQRDPESYGEGYDED